MKWRFWKREPCPRIDICDIKRDLYDYEIICLGDFEGICRYYFSPTSNRKVPSEWKKEADSE